MSQLSFLEAVISWDEAQCRQNAGEALPKLATFLQRSEDVHEQIGITKVICMSLLPWIQLEEAQSQVFAPLASKSSAMLESVLQAIHMLCKEAGSQHEILTSLEMLVELVDCFVCCVKFVQGKATATVDLCHTSSLVMSSIGILKGTYNHCKDSGELYGDMLAGVTEVLSELFKKAHSLQVAVLAVLEKVMVGDHVTGEEVESLHAICQGLFELCHVVTSLDTKLVLGLWKTLSRFSVRHKEHVHDGLDVDAMISYLCRELTSAFQHMCQLAPKETDTEELALSQGDVAAFQRALKVAGYQMKILTFMLDSFAEYTAGSQTDILKLILLIQRYLPPSLTAPSIIQTHVAEIQRHVSNGVEPMIALLVSHPSFAKTVLAPDTDVCDDWFPYLQLLTKVIDLLPQQTAEVQDRWLTCGSSNNTGCGEQSVIECLFKVVEECYIELSAPVMLPGVVVAGKQERPVSLYEYVCTHLCGLVGCLPARYFSHLEECLMLHVFSRNSYVSSMATDVWCYMARFGTAELCYQHTEMLTQTYLRLEDQAGGSGRPLMNLLRRLVKFLAPEHQTRLLKRFAPSAHVDLWKHLPVTVFPAGSQTEVMDTVWRQTEEGIQRFLNNARNTYTDLDDLALSIEGLGVFLQGQDSPRPSATSFMDTHRQLWSAVGCHWQTDQHLQSLLADLLVVTSHLVPHVEEQDILKILKQLPDQLEDCKTKMAVINFLLKISKIHFSPNSELQATMSRVPQLFHALLTDPHALVHHLALDSFTQFAEITPYESLVPQCLNDSERVQETVVAFLNKTAHTHPGYKEAQYMKLQRSCVLEVSRKEPASGNHGDMLDEIGSVEEPVSKRKRTDDMEVCPDLQEIMADFRRTVNRLESVKSSTTIARAEKEELLCINSRLKTVIESL